MGEEASAGLNAKVLLLSRFVFGLANNISGESQLESVFCVMISRSN